MTSGLKVDAAASPVGLKHDQGKPRFDLIDAYATEELAKVLTFGAAKYAEENWRKGISFKRLIAAAKRHINAIEQNQDLDSETGLSHAAHAMCCMMFLLWMQKHRPELDDRYNPDKLKAAVEGLQRDMHSHWDAALPDTSKTATNQLWDPKQMEGSYRSWDLKPSVDLEIGELVKLYGDDTVWEIVGVDLSDELSFKLRGYHDSRRYKNVTPVDFEGSYDSYDVTEASMDAQKAADYAEALAKANKGSFRVGPPIGNTK